MHLDAGPRPGQHEPARPRRGQGAVQARRVARAKGEAGWPPRWLTPVPAADIRRGEGSLVADFINDHCRITEDSFAGTAGSPIHPRLWQRRGLAHIFARLPNGRRRHRTAIYATARKNGKSSLAAGIGLYGLTTEGEGAQVIGAAADRDQAKIIFGTARKMVELDPDLSEEITCYAHVLEHRATGSVYRVISSEAYTKEGLNPTLVIADELHAWPDRELFDVLRLAMGARYDPLMLIVTTAGVMSTRKDDESILYHLYQHALAIIRGEVEDPTFCLCWWSADEDCDHTDERAWHEGNPGLGDILDIEDLRSVVGITAEAEFRTKRLNVFTPVADFWRPAGTWEACRVGNPDPEDLLHGLDRKLPIAVGIDVGLVHDMTAVVIAQQQAKRVVVRARFWGNPHPPETQAHLDWRMPLDEIWEYLRRLRREFPVSAARVDDVTIPGPAYVYDRYGLASTELALEAERGYALIPIAQQGGWMVEASRRFYEAVLDGRVSHDGDPTLAAHLRNVVPRQVAESGWRLEKPSRQRKIDGAVAVTMAVSQALEEPPRTFRAFLA